MHAPSCLQTYGTAAAAIAAVADQALQLASAANEAGATGPFAQPQKRCTAQ